MGGGNGWGKIGITLITRCALRDDTTDGAACVFNFVYDLDVGGHVVFARELLVTIRTRIHLDVALMRGDIVSTEVAYMRIDARTHFTSVGVVTLFGTKIPNRPLRIVYHIFATSVAGNLRLYFDSGRRRR